jgi:hypothetical protein
MIHSSMSLVVAMLLAGVSLARADDKAIAESLKKSGVELKLDVNGFAVSAASRESLTADDYRALGQLRRLKTLSLSGAHSLTDDALALLKDLDELERVTLDGPKLTDDGLKHMAGWKSLRKLTFYNFIHRGKFTGAGVAHLASLPNLEHFACGGSSFTDAGMDACTKLPKLTDLQIWHTPVTNAGMAYLPKLTGLRNLRLASQFAPRITDAGLPHIAAIKTLETLSIGETRLTWDGGLKHLKALPNLKRLELNQVEMSAADLTRLKAALPSIEVLWRPVDEKYRDLLRKNWEKLSESRSPQ